MSLRVQINLIVIVSVLLLAGALVWQQFSGARVSVREEMETANRIAVVVLERLGSGRTADQLKDFLEGLGRLRANDVRLVADDGSLLYESPPPVYRADQRAPSWYSNLVAPAPLQQVVSLQGGTLTVTSDPSRAVLDTWDDVRRLLLTLLLGLVVLLVLVSWWVGRVVGPFRRVRQALAEVERGGYETRLPPFRSSEAQALGSAFNRMAASVKESIAAREEAARAATELNVSREITQAMQARAERESAAIARELHDELGQHVTAIKSMGVSIGRRIGDANPPVVQAAGLIVQSADRIHAGVRSILERLRPTSLDQFGLPDALSDLVSDLRLAYPEKQFTLRIAPGVEGLGDEASTTAYRVAQESLTNALRHAGASAISVSLWSGDGECILQIDDNGRGVDARNPPSEGLGLAGMRERAAIAGGRLDLARSRQGGVTVRLTLPLNGDGTSDSGEAVAQAPDGGHGRGREAA
jgi:two-component system sensor histidine kinase UhpB